MHLVGAAASAFRPAAPRVAAERSGLCVRPNRSSSPRKSRPLDGGAGAGAGQREFVPVQGRLTSPKRGEQGGGGP